MPTQPEDLYDVLVDFLTRLMNISESDGLDALNESDLSFSQARALFLLTKTADPMPIHSIAQALGLSMAAAGRNVDQLVGLHLVERRESSSDRRVKLVSLTPGGRAARGAAHRVQAGVAQGLHPDPSPGAARAAAPGSHGRPRRERPPPTYRPGALLVTAPAPPLPPVYPEKIDGAVLKIAGVVVLGAIMSILDITVVSVALPTFQTEFDATYAQVAWTMTGYTLALATVIPLTGWAADRFGTKRLYMIALLLFTLGSGLCATADIDRAAHRASGSCRASAAACSCRWA